MHLHVAHASRAEHRAIEIGQDFTGRIDRIMHEAREILQARLQQFASI